MATLIKQDIGSHHRRCDARYYNAKSRRCTCICNGVNHGAGYGKAVENSSSSEMAWALLNAEGVEAVQVKLPVIQEAIPIEVY